MIPKLYDSTRESVLHNIKNLKLYSATTDMWFNPYMSYIIHYITEEWELQSTAFGTLPGYFLNTKYQVKNSYTVLY